jgi:flagellar secretion chaperone FliS
MDARSSYRESAVRGANPVQLVIFLYEQAIEDLRRAIVALRRSDIEARTRAINHALVVIGHLQGSLDLERGGAVAQNLVTFYNLMRGSLVQAQLEQSAIILEQQIGYLVFLHEAWLEVERRTSALDARTPELVQSPDEDSVHIRIVGKWDA